MAIGQLSLMLQQGTVWRNLGRVSKPTQWTSLAIGGFGSASIDIPGRDAYTLIDYLSTVRLVNGTEVVWEGQIEDKFLDIKESGDAVTTLQAFGLKKLLEETTLRRIWLKRDISWTQVNLYGLQAGWPTPSTVASDLFFNPQAYAVSPGRFDVADPTRYGIRFQGTGIVAGAHGFGAAVWFYLDTVVATRILFDVTRSNLGDTSFLYESADGTTWTEVYSAGDVSVFTKASLSYALKSTTKFIAFGALWDWTAPAPTDNSVSRIDFENIRILGVATAEDATGGMYGGTILNDVIRQVPGITAGVVESGSDFAIGQCDRYVRSTAQSVVDEVAAYYYQREWAVWEGGVFDWKTVNFDEANYLVRLTDLASLHLEGSIEGLDKTTIVQYAGPSGQTAEASATSTSQRNPYVKKGRTKDGLVQVSFPMTPASAAQLALKLNTDRGNRPAVTGSLTIPIQQVVNNQQGRPVPAFVMRAGRNIVISDLPKSEWFTTGRDGATHFHITAMAIDADKGVVQLDLDGQTRRSDVLLARLSAVTAQFTL